MRAFMIRVLLFLVGDRIVILLLSLCALVVIYIVYRRVFLLRDRSRSKTIEAMIPTLECAGVFDQRILTVNQTTVTYQAQRQFAMHFTAAGSIDEVEKAKVLLFKGIEDKLKETLAANPGADLSSYESAFGIAILNVASSRDH